MKTTRELLIYLRQHIIQGFEAGNSNIHEVIDNLYMMDLIEEGDYNRLLTYVNNNILLDKFNDVDYIVRWLDIQIKNLVPFNFLIKWGLRLLLTILAVLLIFNFK